MKNYSILKRLSIVAVAGLFALTSCNKDTAEPETDGVEESQAILVAEASTSSDAVFIVNTTPPGCEKDSVATSDLRTSIITYLTANYSGFTHVKAFKIKKSGTIEGYIVVIKFNDKPVGLLFNANGDFVKIFEQRERKDLKGKGWHPGGHFDGRDNKHRDTIALSALTATIKTYFAVTYPQDTLLGAHAGHRGDIVVITANKGLFANVFTSTGVFAKRVNLMLHDGRKEAILQAALSAKIAAHLAATYPAFIFHRAYVIKSHSTIKGYVVFINANDTKYGLHFDAEGNLIKTVVVR
ncbi:MAG: PepSY-like domain-containing protein [Pyrinomonadaceae bacterium]|nr:PepSY-like domain-containing protein [Sphingobacteriaceae bacterium]